MKPISLNNEGKNQTISIDELPQMIPIVLSNDELQYIISSMYSTTRDVEKLISQNMIELFKGIIDEYNDQKEIIKDTSEVEEEKQDSNNDSIIEENNSKLRPFHLPISHSLPQEHSTNPLISDGPQLRDRKSVV